MSLKKYVKEVLLEAPKEKAVNMVRLIRGSGIRQSERYVELILKKYYTSNK